jgi:hypothetical protein
MDNIFNEKRQLYVGRQKKIVKCHICGEEAVKEASFFMSTEKGVELMSTCGSVTCAQDMIKGRS